MTLYTLGFVRDIYDFIVLIYCKKKLLNSFFDITGDIGLSILFNVLAFLGKAT